MLIVFSRSLLCADGKGKTRYDDIKCHMKGLCNGLTSVALSPTFSPRQIKNKSGRKQRKISPNVVVTWTGLARYQPKRQSHESPPLYLACGCQSLQHNDYTRRFHCPSPERLLCRAELAVPTEGTSVEITTSLFHPPACITGREHRRYEVCSRFLCNICGVFFAKTKTTDARGCKRVVSNSAKKKNLHGFALLREFSFGLPK